MSVQIVCTHCKASLKTETLPAVGARLKCPKCAGEFRYAPEQLVATAAAPAASPASSTPAANSARAVSPPATPLGKRVASSRRNRWMAFGVAMLLTVAVCGAGIALVLSNLSNKQRPQATASNPSVGATSATGVDESETANHSVTSSVAPTVPADGQATAPLADSNAEVTSSPEEFSIGNDASLYGVALAPDGSSLAAATTSGPMLWDLHSGNQTRIELFSSDGQSARLLFSPSGKHIAMVSRDPLNFQLLRGAVWSVADGTKVLELAYPDAPNGFELPIAFSPKGNYFAVATSDHEIVVTHLTEGRALPKLAGHRASIGALLFSNDEKSLISSSRDTTDGDVRLWNLENAGQSRLLAPGQAATALAATPDGRRLITSSFGVVREWDMSGNGLAILKHDIPETATSLHVDADGKSLRLVANNSAVGNATVTTWDLIEGKVIGRKLAVSVRSPDQYLFSSLSPDGRILYVASHNALALWDVATAQRLTEYPTPSNLGNLVGTAATADGARLATAYQQGTIKLVTVEGSVGSAATTLALKSGVRSLKYSTDGKSLSIGLIPNGFNLEDPALASAMREGQDAFSALARKHSLEKSELVKSKLGPGQSAGALIRSPEMQSLFKERFGRPQQEFLAALSVQLQDLQKSSYPLGEMGALWRIGDPQPAVVLAQPPLAPDEFPLSQGDNSGVGSPADMDPAGPLGAGNLSVVPPAATSNGRLIWVSRQKGIIQVDVYPKEQKILGYADLEIQGWILSPNGKTLFLCGSRLPPIADRHVSASGSNSSGGNESVCALLDLESSRMRTLPIDRLIAPALEACFTPDSKRLLAKTKGTPLEREARQSSVRQWDVSSGTEVGKPILFPAAETVRQMVVSPDGTLLAMVRGTQDMNLHLIDLTTGNERPTTLPEHVALPTFSPDGRTLAVVVTGFHQLKHQIELIDIASGQSRASVSGWNSYVQAMAFSPDSKVLAVGGGSRESINLHSPQLRLPPLGLNATGELKLVDTDKGTILAPLAGHDDQVTAIDFSPDGRTLATGGADRAVKVWDVAGSITSSPKRSPTSTAARVSPAPTASATKKPEAAEAAKPTRLPPTSPAQSRDTAQRTAAESTSAQPALESNSIGMKLVVLKPGEFLMGSPESDPDADASERPQHTVRLTKSFAIGVHEVTVGQFRSFVEATGFQTDGENAGGGTGYDPASRRFVEEFRPEFTWQNIGIEQTDEHPVTNVSWNDAKAFCNWLSIKEGKRYRLPTEAEWEYACRAGTSTRFPAGEHERSLTGKANVGDASLRRSWPAADWTIDWDDGYPFTAPVGRFEANAWGIHDMIGNVCEWCEDRHDPKYYLSSPASDPTGPKSGEFRVVRAGGWYNHPTHQRSAVRGSPDWPPWARSLVIGFRVVRLD